jgi:tight adherence protein B
VVTVSAGTVCALCVVLAAALVRGLGRPPARIGAPPASAPVGPRRVALARLQTWVAARRAARDRDAAWASVADELAATIRAGSSLSQAVASVAEQSGAAAGVVRTVVEPVARGRQLGDAARRWAEGATSSDERLLAEALLLADVGGRPDPLMFEVVADTIRERRALDGELHAQTAQARASAAVLALLPLGFTALVASADSDVTTFLFGTLPGRLCMAVAAVLDGLGAWWMRHTIRSVTS